MATEKVEAPLPGKVLKVNVKPGDKVSEMDEVCIVEAMKMENPIVCTSTGTVKEVLIIPGKVVKAGEVLVIIES
jgi:biotin carboxyl carrier protein